MSMYMESYFIDKRGIYTTRSIYHDDVEYVYHVDFEDEPEKMAENFSSFLRRVRKEGGDEKMRNVKAEFKNLREFMG